MIRRLSVQWPDARPFLERDGRPVRLLAISDDRDPGLAQPANHARIGPIDLVCGCGDLEPDYLEYVADAFNAPIAYVRGNHDRGLGWREWQERLPEPLANGKRRTEFGIPLIGFSWPVGSGPERTRDEGAAWRQVLSLGVRAALKPHEPAIVLSHAPPASLGDAPADLYHRGFPAYRWLLERLRPVLWLHGHTPLAGASDWRCSQDATTLANVTGAVVVELAAPVVEEAPERAVPAVVAGR